MLLQRIMATKINNAKTGCLALMPRLRSAASIERTASRNCSASVIVPPSVERKRTVAALDHARREPELFRACRLERGRLTLRAAEPSWRSAELAEQSQTYGIGTVIERMCVALCAPFIQEHPPFNLPGSRDGGSLSDFASWSLLSGHFSPRQAP